MTFNGLVRKFVENEKEAAEKCALLGNKYFGFDDGQEYFDQEAQHINKCTLWEPKIDRAMFDARAFNIPKE